MCPQDFSTDNLPSGGIQVQPEFNQEVEAQGDSDMEGWDDDGWGDMNSEFQTKPPQQTVPSSGADFFDTFDSKISSTAKTKTGKTDDIFDSVQGPWSAKSSKKEKTPPPPVSSSLFGGGGDEAGEGGDTGDGWGDWNDDFKEPPKQVNRVKV